MSWRLSVLLECELSLVVTACIVLVVMKPPFRPYKNVLICLPQRLFLISACRSAVIVACALSLFLPLASFSGDVFDSQSVDPALRSIRPHAIRAHMRVLSDPLLEGRAPDSPGYGMAARYVAAQLGSLGLQLGAHDSWYQSVPLRKSVLDQSKSTLALVKDGKEQNLVDGQDYVLTANIVNHELSLDAPIVFAGFGVTAPEENYDDYAGVDVQGRIVAVFSGAPPRFASTIRAYYADDMIKAQNAKTHGAAAILTLFLPEDLKRQPWDWNVPQYRAGETRWLEQSGEPHNPFSYSGVAVLNKHASAVLFTGSAYTLEEAYAAARHSRPLSFPLSWSARVRAAYTMKSFSSANIIGVLEGSDPRLKSEYVVYTAHVDHLGLCPPVNGDNVCHGTLDNASGVAALLEIARAYASLPTRPRRSIAFVFVTGEEAGLLGSDYYAHFPTVPSSSIVANVNIDELPGLLYPMKNVVALGAEHSSLRFSVERAAKKAGYRLAADPLPEENFFIRSDQYSFVLRGIPAVYLCDGPGSSDPAVNGLEVIKKWNITRYHTPLDNMEQPMNFTSAVRAAQLIFLVGYDIAQQEQIPVWNRDDFFGLRFGALHPSSIASR